MTTAEKHEFPMARTCPFAPPPADEQIQGYMADLITEKEKNPPDDLLGRQIVKLRADGTYRREALSAGRGQARSRGAAPRWSLPTSTSPTVQ